MQLVTEKADAASAKTSRAEAQWVRGRVGLPIAGVSPVAPAQDPVTLSDRELFRIDDICAAAGHVRALGKRYLQHLSRGQWPHLPGQVSR